MKRLATFGRCRFLKQYLGSINLREKHGQTNFSKKRLTQSLDALSCAVKQHEIFRLGFYGISSNISEPRFNPFPDSNSNRKEGTDRSQKNSNHK